MQKVLPLLARESYRWDAYALPWLVVGFALLVLTTVVFVRQRASRVAVMFCAMTVLVGVWFGGFAAMILARDPDVALDWARLALAGICLLPAAVYDFTATALRLTIARRVVVRTLWSVSLLFAGASLFSGSFATAVRLRFWGFYPIAGPLLAFFLVYFFAALAASMVEYAIEYRRTTDRLRRRRLVRLMTEFLVVYLAAVDFIPMFGPRGQPVGYVPVAAFMAIAWRSIRRHRLAPITAAGAAREILDTMADALLVVDGGGRVRVVNGAVATLFGYTATDLVGRPVDVLDTAEPERSIWSAIGRLPAHGTIRDQEHVFRARNGHDIHVSVSISRIGEHETQEGAVVIARDIRERKRVDHELDSLLRQLQQSNRELEEFAYVASHDLQEPLRKIQAFADLLKAKYGENVPAQGLDYLDRMQSAAHRMQILINDLLTFSRVTTKAQPFTRVSLGDVAREVAHDLEMRVRDAGGTIDVGELPWIDADPLQMRQLLQNLIANALKFHRPGVPPVVTLAGRLEMDGGGTPVCRLTVTDNGIGFEEKYADRIFTMFERLHGRGKYEGTGIGLAICRKIAQRHRGDIEAHGVPGEGATFTVTLPAEQEMDERHAFDA